MKFKSTLHWLHLILTLLTGVWLVMWIMFSLTNSVNNRKLELQLIKRQTQLLEELVKNKGLE